MDLVIDTEGNIYFLEVNQAGQFLFIEEVLPGIPLLHAMTAFLSSGRVDYSMHCVKSRRFADYSVTEHHAQAIERQKKRTISEQFQAVEA